MELQYLFFLVFGLGAAYFAFQVVRNRGLRGAMFGARLVRTIGELDLGRRGMVRTTLKVHCLEPRDSASPTVGVELVATSYGGFGMTPIALTSEQASGFAALLAQAVRESAALTRVG